MKAEKPLPLDELLSQYELYEPKLGEALRTSPHIQVLLTGKADLAAWEATSLTYLYGPANSAAFAGLVKAMRLPEALQTALLRREQAGHYDYYWNWDYTERAEHVRLDGPELEIGFANRKGHARLRIKAPALEPAARAAALEWLSGPAVLEAVAQGRALDPEWLTQRGLVPAWETCEVAASARSRETLETGVLFICRALVMHPAYLLIMRGLGGEAAVRRCVEQELTRRRADFEAAARDLPAARTEFWAAPPTPSLPAPHEVEPGAGLGVHLPPARFWPRDQDNWLFGDALQKVYKNIPRKLARLTAPRRY